MSLTALLGLAARMSSSSSRAVCVSCLGVSGPSLNKASTPQGPRRSDLGRASTRIGVGIVLPVMLHASGALRGTAGAIGT